MQHKIKVLLHILVITILVIIVPKTTFSQGVAYEKAILDYKIDTGIRLHPTLVRKTTHGQIEKDIVQWVIDNFDTSGNGFNLSNHDLITNGNYSHDWNNYQFKITRIVNFLMSDTSSTIFFTTDSLLTLGKSNHGFIIDRSLGSIMVDSSYYLPTTAGVSLGSVLQSTGTYTTAFLPITNINLISRYNGTNTAGNGLFAIRSHGSYKNRSTSITVTSYTVPVDGEYLISGYFSVSSITGTTEYSISFTDQNSIPQTILSYSATTTGVHQINSVEIQALSGTVISITTNIASGSVTYDVSATITQIN